MLHQVTYLCVRKLKDVVQHPACRRIYSEQTTHFSTKPSILKPAIFAFGLTCTSFAGAAIIQYERAEKKLNRQNIFQRMSGKAFTFRSKVNKWWHGLYEGQRVAATIIAVNLGVLTIWKFPSCSLFMTKWFTSSTVNRRSSTLLLSCFSHSEFWHFGANMFVLWSFSPLIHSLLGTEQFIAFYLTGGTVSSLVSYYFKIATHSKIPSLGASGALLAVIAVCCIEQPDARLSILFLPFFTFSAQTALYSLIAVDVTGIILRWQLFDHAAHLGGTLFGSWYVLYGHKYLWDRRSSLVRWWHNQKKGWK